MPWTLFYKLLFPLYYVLRISHIGALTSTSFLVCVYSVGDWAQSLMHTGQELYPNLSISFFLMAAKYLLVWRNNFPNWLWIINWFSKRLQFQQCWQKSPTNTCVLSGSVRGTPCYKIKYELKNKSAHISIFPIGMTLTFSLTSFFFFAFNCFFSNI
jgi:hypothetical protein